jgi:hypothetical protein
VAFVPFNDATATVIQTSSTAMCIDSGHGLLESRMFSGEVDCTANIYFSRLKILSD